MKAAISTDLHVKVDPSDRWSKASVLLIMNTLPFFIVVQSTNTQPLMAIMLLGRPVFRVWVVVYHFHVQYVGNWSWFCYSRTIILHSHIDFFMVDLLMWGSVVLP